MTGLTIHQTSHSYGTQSVLNKIDVSVDKGTLTSLLGPSGCGKTTLLRITAGLEALQQGVIKIGDQMVAKTGLIDLPPERRNIGLMFQDYALFPNLTVMDNIRFGVKKKSGPKLEWIKSTLGQMGLSGFENRYPHELSGGQQQRIALLRALAPEPTLLLLDEAFSELDVTLRSQVREQTLEILKKRGQTALLVTHDPEEAMFMSDQLLIMDEGRIIQSGTSIEIYQNPKTAFVAGLFGPINCLTAKVNGGDFVDTIFGKFPVKGVAPGGLVNILIRPEGVTPTPSRGNNTGTIALKVLSARPIGEATHLRLKSECALSENTTFFARTPGIFLPELGSTNYFKIDNKHVFIFPSQY